MLLHVKRCYLYLMNLAIVGISMPLETSVPRGSLPTSRTADSLVRIDRARGFLQGCCGQGRGALTTADNLAWQMRADRAGISRSRFGRGHRARLKGREHQIYFTSLWNFCAVVLIHRDADHAPLSQEMVIFDVLLSGSVTGDIKGTES